ncbi:MAG: hypothetical protein WBN94_00895, partial [Methanothrix sp.]
ANNKDDPIELERPCLLDPMNASDPRLISFDQFGSAKPKYDKNECITYYNRAKKSIKLYNLNHTKLRERRGILYNNIVDAVEHVDNISADDYINFEHAINNLAKMICEDAEFSAAARAYLSGLRSKKRRWLPELLESC